MAPRKTPPPRGLQDAPGGIPGDGGIPAFAYARYSSENQSEDSIETQMESICRYAAANGFQVVQTYCDRATSATSTDDRTEFLRMFSDIGAGIGGVQAVLVYKLSRYARNSYDALRFERELNSRGVRLIAVTQDIQTHRGDGSVSPEGLLFRRMQYAIDEYSSLLNSAQVTAHMFQLARSKQPHLGGKPPYGYRLVLSDPTDYKSYRVLEVNPEEAENVRYIFESVQKGTGYGEILDELNRRGARTRDGKVFGKGSLNSILKNPRYAGTYVYGQFRYNHITTKQKEDNPEAVVLDGALPEIVPRNLWEDVHLLMTGRKRRSGGHQKHEYLLSGYLFCEKCGAPMCGSRGERNGPPATGAGTRGVLGGKWASREWRCP